MNDLELDWIIPHSGMFHRETAAATCLPAGRIENPHPASGAMKVFLFQAMRFKDAGLSRIAGCSIGR
ncbi:hypothetical protein, partial [Muriicola sp.]|uniref:hypothetical protein n=1 Tax=Muriicola sp. TaxID=2020856 RepID=UPI003567A167